jgi:secernin
MCDTVAMFSRDGSGRSFFGKNSDREPGEPQIVYYSENPVDEFNQRPYIEASSKYTSGPLLALKSIFDKFDNPYSALISRPVWMWGAEMGVNQFGLSIEFVNFFLRKGSLKSKLVERELDICAVRKIQPRKNFTCPLKIDDAYFARGIFFYEVD